MRRTSPVHPHARGDDATVSRSTGSRHRFTPTRVGTMRTDQSRRRPSEPVHPHARGDDCRVLAMLACSTAVHPHARGDDLLPW